MNQHCTADPITRLCPQCGIAMYDWLKLHPRVQKVVSQQRECPAWQKWNNERESKMGLCRHLLDPTSDVVELTNCNCPGSINGKKRVYIYECEIDAHPLCIVNLRGDSPEPSIHRCRDCQDFLSSTTSLPAK